MATFQKNVSMSDDSADRLAKMLFGVDRGEFDIALSNLNECYFQRIAQLAKTLSAMRSPLLEAIARGSISLAQKIEAAPEIPSYEKLLIEKAGYSRLGARLMAHQICHWGKNQAAEINEGRRLRALIDKVADAEGRSALAMSRRARKLRDQSRSLEARDLIDGAIKKANLSLTAVQFHKLVELVCERDETACRDLGRMSKQLAPHLPEKRGRPISEEACIHLFLLHHLESWGNKCAYTYSEKDGINDFVDPVMQATRLALRNDRFSPRYANILHKKKMLLPPVLRVDSSRIEHCAPRRPGLGVIEQRKSLKPRFSSENFQHFASLRISAFGGIPVSS
ncbi:MAG: hypothetical protein ACREC0_10585 [Methylocella sp.]